MDCAKIYLLMNRYAGMCAASATIGAFMLLMLYVMYFCLLPLGGGDIFWQIRAGEEILRTWAVPSVESWSYTVPGMPWNNHEWGWALLVAVIYRIGSWSGLHVLLLVLWSALLIGTVCISVPRLGWPLALVMLVCLVMLGSYKFNPAPQMLSMVLFFAAWHLFCDDRLLASPARLACLAALLLVWGNLTAEVLMFLPFLIVNQCSQPGFGRCWRRHILAFALACLIPLINPPGSSVLEYVITGTQVNRLVNTEFARLWESAFTILPLVKWLARAVVATWAVFLACCLVTASNRKAVCARFATDALAVAGAVLYERNIWLLILPLGHMLGRLHAAIAVRQRLAFFAPAAVCLAATCFYVWVYQLGVPPATLVRRLQRPAPAMESSSIPWQCGDALNQVPAGAHLFTSRIWANYVLWRAPHVKVFIDGRNREYPVAAAFLIWEGNPQALDLLAKTHTRWVLARPGWHQLPHIQPGNWQPVAAVDTCAIYTRRTQPTLP
jgi:hypothetical protein